MTRQVFESDTHFTGQQMIRSWNLVFSPEQHFSNRRQPHQHIIGRDGTQGSRRKRARSWPKSGIWTQRTIPDRCRRNTYRVRRYLRLAFWTRSSSTFLPDNPMIWPPNRMFGHGEYFPDCQLKFFLRYLNYIFNSYSNEKKSSINLSKTLFRILSRNANILIRK